MYAEDMDLCLKVARAGFEIYHAPEAVVVHHGGVSSGSQFSKFSTIMIREALNVYFVLNHGLSAAYQYRVLMGVSAFFRLTTLALCCIFTAFKDNNSKVSAAKWWAILRWVFGGENWARKHFQIPSGAGKPSPNTTQENIIKSVRASKDEEVCI
jgi:GT2 family glycosyltransferase